MDNRERMIRMLLSMEDGSGISMAYGFIRKIYRENKHRRLNAGSWPGVNRRMEAVRLLLEINNDKFINRIYISLRDYVGEGTVN